MNTITIGGVEVADMEVPKIYEALKATLSTSDLLNLGTCIAMGAIPAKPGLFSFEKK